VTHVQQEIAHWLGIWLVKEQGHGPSAQAVNCGPTEPTGCTGNGGASNQDEIDELALAYVVETEQKVRSGCTNLLEKWFGESSNDLKETVLGGLQFLADTIQNPFYVNWEDYAGYYGWVYPGETVDGKLVIHFGKTYFDSGMADRVGTITHEAAHHPPLRRRDREHRRRNGPKQYCDVPGCLELARTEPDEAQLNDDNWSFFIDDLVGGGMAAGSPAECSGGGGGGTPPRRRSSPSPPRRRSTTTPGCQTQTESGRECANWNSEAAEQQGYTPSDYPGEYPGGSLGDHSCCRNPDGHTGLWCLTGSLGNDWWEDC